MIELIASQASEVEGMPVRRALPRRPHRSIGAWCFFDHMGPYGAAPGQGVAIGPHPHIGLQTVTWLVAGEIIHRDSLGSEQPIRPGQLNLMTAGGGIAHSEESAPAFGGTVHGAQLWVAQPDATRHGPPRFEHHPALPQVALASGTGTVLAGTFSGASSPASGDTGHVGVDLDLRRGATTLALEPAYEYGVVVLGGAVRIRAGAARIPGAEGHGQGAGGQEGGGPLPGEQVAAPGVLAYVRPGHQELAIMADAPARAMLIGGVPFPEPLLMWWNFVARTRQEIEAAALQWAAGEGGFAVVAGSALPKIPAPPRHWAAK